MSGNRVKVLNNGLVVRDVAFMGADHPIEVDIGGIQQIEIVKGPSSILYSNGAIGGIVNIVDNTIAKIDVLENVFNLGFESQSVNDGDNYNSKAMNNLKTKKDTSYQRYNDHNDVADEVNSKRFLKLNNDVGTVNAEHVSNDVLHLNGKNVAFGNRNNIVNDKVA